MNINIIMSESSSQLEGRQYLVDVDENYNLPLLRSKAAKRRSHMRSALKRIESTLTLPPVLNKPSDHTLSGILINWDMDGAICTISFQKQQKLELLFKVVVKVDMFGW